MYENEKVTYKTPQQRKYSSVLDQSSPDSDHDDNNSRMTRRSLYDNTTFRDKSAFYDDSSSFQSRQAGFDLGTAFKNRYEKNTPLDKLDDSQLFNNNTPARSSNPDQEEANHQDIFLRDIDHNSSPFKLGAKNASKQFEGGINKWNDQKNDLIIPQKIEEGDSADEDDSEDYEERMYAAQAKSRPSFRSSFNRGSFV